MVSPVTSKNMKGAIEEAFDFVKGQYGQSVIGNIDLVDDGLFFEFKTKDGYQVSGIHDAKLKRLAQQSGIPPEDIDKVKELPPEQRKKYAYALLYRILQNEDFKKQFFLALKERGAIIPETKENRAFLNIMNYVIIGVIVGLVIMVLLTMVGIGVG